MDNIAELKRKFRVHRYEASKVRGIPFLLTFEEWYNIWVTSGHLAERGTKRGQYCMSRPNDVGPYAVGNVFIQLTSQNSIDAKLGKKATDEHKRKNADANRGKVRTLEHIANMKAAQLLRYSKARNLLDT